MARFADYTSRVLATGPRRNFSRPSLAKLVESSSTEVLRSAQDDRSYEKRHRIPRGKAGSSAALAALRFGRNDKLFSLLPRTSGRNERLFHCLARHASSPRFESTGGRPSGLYVGEVESVELGPEDVAFSRRA